METLIDLILAALAYIGIAYCFAIGACVILAVIDSFGRDDE